jgi:hypothetical protein
MSMAEWEPVDLSLHHEKLKREERTPGKLKPLITIITTRYTKGIYFCNHFFTNWQEIGSMGIVSSFIRKKFLYLAQRKQIKTSCCWAGGGEVWWKHIAI